VKSLLHFARFVFGLDSVASQVTDRELQMLLRYSRNASVICELGCYEARTSVELALNTNGAVYSIDPFYAGRLGMCYTEYIARIHRWRREVKKLVFIKGLSANVVQNFDLPIDFLFIDADHSYKAAKEDWKLWFPKVKKQGYVALHDSKLAPNSPQLLGSMRFYSEEIRRMKGVVECDSIDSLAIVQSQSQFVTGE
jgi:hypothetical protein